MMTMAFKYHMIAQVTVRADSSDDLALSGKFTPALKAILQPAACEAGADTVASSSMVATGSFGTSSVVMFYILKQREGTEPPPSPPPAETDGTKAL